mmetsp:Transcript_37514/g.90492  ORF Transcript_37514/g.90492 Transcript_37514/m.90492 type:complete len:854 (-) Transcript_37514:470-3031(-)
MGGRGGRMEKRRRRRHRSESRSSSSEATAMASVRNTIDVRHRRSGTECVGTDGDRTVVVVDASGGTSERSARGDARTVAGRRERETMDDHVGPGDGSSPKKAREKNSVDDDDDVQPNIQSQAAERRAKDIREKSEFETWKADWETYTGTTLAEHYAKRHADGWERRLEELGRYYNNHRRVVADADGKDDGNGDSTMNEATKIPPPPPLDYRDPDDLTLGEWARRQGELCREGKLDRERAEKLARMGFDFDYYRVVPPTAAAAAAPDSTMLTGDERWDGKLRELIEFKKKFLHADVPPDYDSAPAIQTLGHWAHEQRELYVAGTLESRRHVILDQKGFVFEPGTNVEPGKTIVGEAWRNNFRELVQFKRDHGHLEVPTRYKPSSLSVYLDKWIGKQRAKYKQNELPMTHITLLEEIGLDLTARKRVIHHDLWARRFSELLSYREENGHVNVPKNVTPLSYWVKAQRRRGRKGELPEDKRRRLADIGFDFDPSKKLGNDGDAAVTPPPPLANKADDPIFDSPVWLATYEALKSFVEAKGHANVPPGHDDEIGCCLHTWLETQKNFFERDELPRSRVRMFGELGVDLGEKGGEDRSENRNDVAWARSFKALEEFHGENGRLEVPYGYKPVGFGGYRCLASWVSKQREFFTNNKLAEDRVQKLESLGMILAGDKRYRRHNRRTNKYAILGKMPDDNLWFDHDDGVRRRIPSTWKFPRFCLEEMYLLYHCHSHLEGDIEKKISPMKLFMPTDMVIAKRDVTNLGEVKQLCGIIDQECVRKGVEIEGFMTEEDARRCVRIGYHGLNIHPLDDGTPMNALVLKWRNVYRLKNPQGRDKKSLTGDHAHVSGPTKSHGVSKP